MTGIQKGGIALAIVTVGLAVLAVALPKNDTGRTVTDMDARTHACALVAWWSDLTGTVSDPDADVTTQPEVIALAKAAWPEDTGAAARFVQLYTDLGSDQTDAEYAVEADQFSAVNC